MNPVGIGSHFLRGNDKSGGGSGLGAVVAVRRVSFAGGDGACGDVHRGGGVHARERYLCRGEVPAVDVRGEVHREAVHGVAEGERDVLTLTRRDGRGEQQVFVRGCGCVENGCRRVCDSLRFRVVGGEGDGVGHAQLVPPEGGRAYGVGAVGELGGGARGGVQPQHVARFKVSAAVRADGGTAAEASGVGSSSDGGPDVHRGTGWFVRLVILTASCEGKRCGQCCRQ